MFSPVVLSVGGGISAAVKENALPSGKVTDARNFLFQRGTALTRPGLSKETGSGYPTGVIYVQELYLHRSSTDLDKTSILVTDDDSIYQFDAMGVPRTELTPVSTAAAFSDADLMNAASVNGLILIANNPGGMVRWDPAGTTYTIIPSSPYHFVTGHISRAVGAYEIGGFAAKVGWSVTGDETDWISAGSGSAVLADIPDKVTGLKTVRNTIVLVRTSGFHLGYPTGTSDPAFRFEAFSQEGAGCPYPSTIAITDDFMAYCGADNVYMFDLSRISPIGDEIRDRLFPYLKNGVVFRGFFTREIPFSSVDLEYGGNDSNAGYSTRLMFHLAAAGFPHFIYDFTEGSWSIHTYDDNTLSVPFSLGFPAFYGTDGFINRWDLRERVETTAYLTLPTLEIGDLDQNFRAGPIILRYRDQGVVESIIVNSICKGDEGKMVEDTVNTSIGTAEADGRFMRTKFLTNLVGNGFETTIEVPENKSLILDAVMIKIQQAGVFKG